MKFILVLALVCVALTLAQSSCNVTIPSGTIYLSRIPTATLQINQVYNGATTPFTWVINLCQAVDTPPSGDSSCPYGAGYIQEYSDSEGICEFVWPTQIAPWSYDTSKSAITSVFTQVVNGQNWTATVYVGCGNSVELTALGDVEVSGGGGVFWYTFHLGMHALCSTPTPPPGPPSPPAPPSPPGPSSCSVSTAIGTVDLSNIPTATLSIDQEYNGQLTPYNWVINLCEAVNQPPPTYTPCSAGAGFISEFSNNGICQSVWQNQAIPWSYISGLDVATATFTPTSGGDKRWTATIYLGCASSDTLVSQGNVDVSGTGKLSFTFHLGVSAMCGKGPVPPGPPPPPSTYTVQQTLCQDANCTGSGCYNTTYPTNQCLPLPSNASMFLTCSPTGSAVRYTMYPNSHDCTGSGSTESIPTDECTKDENEGGFINTQCLAGNARLVNEKLQLRDVLGMLKKPKKTV